MRPLYKTYLFASYTAHAVCQIILLPCRMAGDVKKFALRFR